MGSLAVKMAVVDDGVNGCQLVDGFFVVGCVAKYDNVVRHYIVVVSESLQGPWLVVIGGIGDDNISGEFILQFL